MGKEKQSERGGMSPFKRQCFVTLGVCLNMSSHGMVMGFAAVLNPRLREPDSIIPIDDSTASWIASILGFALITGNFIVPTIMAKYGRKIANLLSIIPLLVGWFGILLANNITTLLIARFLQGTSMGMSASLGGVLIGEYTSPKNRGAFLTLISLSIAAGVLAIHTMGSFLSWQQTSLVCAIIAFVDYLMVMYSPETPSWLADQGRYEECRRVFRWLRGYGEEDELNKMIAASIIVREAKADAYVSETFTKKVRTNLAYFRTILGKKEFYKPIFLMIHIYMLGQWAGANILSAYAVDIFHIILGKDVNVTVMIISMGIQRLVSNTIAVYVIKKIKRRTMLFCSAGLNVSAFLTTAAYTYAKTHNLLPFDHYLIGVVLIHIHMFSIASGTVPLPYIIGGEVFPLEYRSLAGALAVVFQSINLFITAKTVPFLFSTIGLHGAYCLYAGVVGYCTLIAWGFLPETKDRTLQDIEDEFRGRPLSPEEMKSLESLTSVKLRDAGRRASTPMI